MEQQNFNLKLLHLLALHDAGLTLLFILLITFNNIYLGIIIILWPFFEGVYFYFTTSEIDHKIRDRIRKDFSIHQSIIIRCSGEKASQVIEIPFFKIINLSSETISEVYGSNPDPDDKKIFRGIIAHELGHIGQYDRLLIRWLQGSLCCLYLYLSFGMLILILFPIFSNSQEFKLAPVMFLLIQFLGVRVLQSIIYRVTHRREYIADLKAYLSPYKTSLQCFISDGIRMLKRSNQTAQKNKKNNDFTHPSFINRENNILNVIPTTLIQTRVIATQWLTVLILTVSYLAATTFLTLVHQFFLIIILTTLIIALVFWNLGRITQNYHIIKNMAIEYSKGLFSALAIVFTGVFFLKFILQTKGLQETKFLLAWTLFLIILMIVILLFLGVYLAIIRLRNQNKSFQENNKIATVTHTRLDLWNNLIFILAINFSFYYIANFFYIAMPQVYTSIMKPVTAQIVAFVVVLVFLIASKVLWVLRQSRDKKWSNIRSNIYTFSIVLFSYFFCIHLTNISRFPMMQSMPEDWYNPIHLIKLGFAISVDLVLWFLIVMISRDDKIK